MDCRWIVYSSEKKVETFESALRHDNMTAGV